QINTAGTCHLDARMVAGVLDDLPLKGLDLLFIENVGNLVCPAEFDLGETSRTMIASVAEGHDKPEKYPLIFREVDAVLLNKIDLMGHCDFDLERFQEVVTALNPGAPLIEMSCREGSGVEEWRRWVLESVVAGEPSGRDRLARHP
ncbi:MAG: hydrogenase nickel incorporation protein HypB, partial [Pseudomonadota bacterium]